MRLFDFVASLAGIIVLSPLLGLIALAIKATSPGPVFYRARRIGKDGEEFRLYKFRTMFVGADKTGNMLTVAGDPRVTPIGRLLRRTKLDELPQLLNVIRGEMSLVGPRPEDPRYVRLYSREQRQVLSVRPGITSLASLQYRDESSLLTGPDWEKRYVEEIMPAKLAIELEYIRQRSFRQDVRIILNTVSTVVKPG